MHTAFLRNHYSSRQRTIGKSRDVDMINGAIFPRLVAYTLPMLFSGILQLLYNAADVAVVGRFASDGEKALAAVGSTGSLTNLIVSLFLGLSVGTCVIVSQGLGAGREKDVSETVHTAILTSLIMGAALSAVGIIFAKDFLSMMDTPSDVIDWSSLYMRIYFAGLPASMLYNFGGAVLRAKGNTKFPLIVLIVSGLVNVLLNLLTVIVFKMDVAGVALATVSSQIVSAVMVIIRLATLDDCCKLYFRKLRIYPDKLWKMARFGIPAGLQGVFFSLSNVVLQSAVNSLERTAMAGNTAASNVDGFIYISCNSVYHGALAFCGQNFGAKKYKRIIRVLVSSILLVLIIGLTLGAVAYIFTDQLLTIYAPGADKAAVREYGALRLRITAPTYFLCGLMEVGSGMLRGLGTSIIPMVISLFGSVILRIAWVKLLFERVERFHDMFWLFMTYPISWIFTTAVQYAAFLIYFAYIRKKLAAIEEDGAATEND